MQDAADVRAIAAALALTGRTQDWLATQLGLPRSTLRAGLYRQRTLSAEKLAAIWCVLEAAGVRRLPQCLDQAIDILEATPQVLSALVPPSIICPVARSMPITRPAGC